MAAGLDLFAERAESADAIGRFAGAAEARGFEAFAARAARIWRTLESSFIREDRPSVLDLVAKAGARDLMGISPFTTLDRALAEHFRDPRLRQLFGRYATYCGSSPYDSPATLMLVAHVESEGVWLVEGGMHRLAVALAALAERLGARIRYGAGVRSMTQRGGRAGGVVLADGEPVAADAIICNGDSNAVATGLFGDLGAGVRPTAPAERSLSALTWAVRTLPAGFPLLRHTVFFSDDYRAEFDALKRGRLPAVPTVYICAQDRTDQEAQAGEPERLLCLVNAPATGDTGKPTQEEIARCEERTLHQLRRCGPDAEPRPPERDDHGRDNGASAVRNSIPGNGGRAVRAERPWLGGVLPPAGGADETAGPLPGGGQHPSGSGGADGGSFRADGGVGADGGPRFDRAVPLNGYVWWYVDALSEDGRHGITLIAFLGSVFSPYYAFRRRGGATVEPLAHAALNVALYGRPGRWAMTERGQGSVRRDAGGLAIGPSSLRWDGSTLVIAIRETGVPLPRPIRGEVRVTPEALTGFSAALDDAGRHRWRPMAPRARVEVTLDAPRLRWSGTGYLDSNDGDEPLEAGFHRWDWSRAVLAGGETAILYDTFPRAGGDRGIAIHIARDGAVTPIASPPLVSLPRTRWRLPRFTRAEDGAARVARTLTDAPFYARSVLETRLLGGRAEAIHESVDLGRFAAPWTQLMLPFRMPRALR